ncbi:hypothetical protein ACQ9BA_24700, partial [Escherichia coli]
TSIFSHPVYLFLRKFSLQDSRGGSDTPRCATDAPAPEALSVACAASCHVEFHYGKMMLENPSPELLTVLIRELTGRGR